MWEPMNHHSLIHKPANKKIFNATSPDQLDLCPYCVEFMGKAISAAANHILKGEGCNIICAILTSNSIENMVCKLVCDYFGAKAFATMINSTNVDPIYACQLSMVCPKVTDGKAIIKSTTIKPSSSVTIGSTIIIDFIYDIIKRTGPGLLVARITSDSNEDIYIKESSFVEGQEENSYNARFLLETVPTIMDPFTTGRYDVYLAVCEGECAHNNPYEGIYATATTSFYLKD